MLKDLRLASKEGSRPKPEHSEDRSPSRFPITMKVALSFAMEGITALSQADFKTAAMESALALSASTRAYFNP
jgi:hypothetical protein